jgi:hypothetical protein
VAADEQRRKMAMDRDDRLCEMTTTDKKTGDDQHHRMGIIVRKTDGAMDDRHHKIVTTVEMESGTHRRILIMETDDIMNERIVMKRTIDEGD